MGRKSTVNLNLPPYLRARVQKSGKTYYYFDTGAKPRVEKSLGSDYPQALKQYAELTINHPQSLVVTFQMAIDKYVREVLPTKSVATQKDYLKCLKNISLFFMPMNYSQFFTTNPLRSMR